MESEYVGKTQFFMMRGKLVALEVRQHLKPLGLLILRSLDLEWEAECSVEKWKAQAKILEQIRDEEIG